MEELLHDHILDSQAVERRMLVRVITPPGYSEGAEPYPFLLFLHPWGLSPGYITGKLNIHLHLRDGVQNGTLPPMIIAIPSGGKSFFLNAADPPGHDWANVVAQNEGFFQGALQSYGGYGDYLLNEVLPFVENEYSIRMDTAGRAIGGISMGGAAAVVHGFQNPPRFGAVGIHSPAVFLGGPGSYGPPWIYGVDQESLAQRSPFEVARRLIPSIQPRIYLDCGDRDKLRKAVDRLHETFDECGIKHTYEVPPGGHDKTYWEPRMSHYLAFYAQGWR